MNNHYFTAPHGSAKDLSSALLLFLSFALCVVSSSCGRGVTIPPPGTDRTPPGLRVTIASATHGVQHDYSNSDRAVLYPPKGEVTFVVVATDSGGVSGVQLFDTCDPTVSNCTAVAQVNGNRSNPVDTLQLYFAPDLLTISRRAEEHAFHVVSTDFSGNVTRQGPLFLQAMPVPSDRTNYQDPGNIIDITGVVTVDPLTDSHAYNPRDPDFHYHFLADAQFEDLENTIGTDIHDGGEFEPEQNGFNSQLLGWVTVPSTPGVFWPWIPTHDSFGNELHVGDHIRIVGRLRYDHLDLYVGCWDNGASNAAFQARNQGHVEIHPIDLIENIQQTSPLASTAHTVRRLSVCNGPPMDTILAPLAPRPAGFVASINETFDTGFTVRERLTAHTLERLSDGSGIHLFVAGNKFRARYELWWSDPNQAVIQTTLPLGNPLSTLLDTSDDDCGASTLIIDRQPRVNIGQGEAVGFEDSGEFHWFCGGPNDTGSTTCPNATHWIVIERDPTGDEFRTSCYDHRP